jgi:ATP-dependent DNA ligase
LRSSLNLGSGGAKGSGRRPGCRVGDLAAAVPIEDRKVLLRDVVGAAGCKQILYVDHIVGSGSDLLEAVNRIGAEGIVSKSRGNRYRGVTSRDWLKTKVFSTGRHHRLRRARPGPARGDLYR